MNKTFTALLLALTLAAPARAQMGEKLRDEYHKESELGIKVITDKEVPMLTATLQDPKLKILCAQVSSKVIDLPKAQLLIDWVRAGHSLWIYDARLGPWFGFEPLLMKPEQFTNKPLKGDLGGHKVEGTAAAAMALKDSPLVTGVDGVTTWLPKLDDGTYGAVVIKGDTLPLLQFTLGSPAVAACRREGHGLIVFKPLVWTETLTGDRFQRNLLEFSAGYEIPGPAGVGSVGIPIGPKADFVKGTPAVPLLTADFQPVMSPIPDPSVKIKAGSPSVANATVKPPDPNVGIPIADATPKAIDPKKPPQTTRIDCHDGVFNCSVVDETLKFETGTESLKVHPKDIKLLIIGDASSGLDVLETWDGQTRKGFLLSPDIEIQKGNERKKIKKRDLHRLEPAAPAGH